LRSSADLLQSFRRYYGENERQVAVAFFVAGFVFDIFTTGRIDSWLTIGQQLAYLAIVTLALTQLLLEEGQPPRDFAAMRALQRWYFKYRSAILHFLLGALLSLYAIFFFKSSSLFASFGFLAVLVTLLIANEWERFRKLGLPFKFALLALCWLSFAAYLVPIVAGSMGTTVFLFSMLVGCLPLAITASRVKPVMRQILTPLGCVLLGFLTLYFFRVIPPVPLSIPFIGIYHGVERTQQTFLLTHERPWWRFWHNGDQDFTARPGDRVYVYFRVFSPTNFSDQVLLRWYRRTPAWTLQDTIPIRISGGREAGFRGYGFKTNYEDGRWKVQVETTDGREIGRVYFDLAKAPAGARSFDLDVD
jgi:DUF2914 family protein